MKLGRRRLDEPIPPGVRVITPGKVDNYGPPPGHTWVTCWCESSIVAVPKALVGRETYSCGRRGCKR